MRIINPFKSHLQTEGLFERFQDLLKVSLIYYYYLPKLEENNLVCPSSRLSLRAILSGFPYTNLNTILGM